MTKTLSSASEPISPNLRFMSEIYGEVLENYLQGDDYAKRCLEISGELGGAMRYMCSYHSLQRITFWKGRDLVLLVAKELMRKGIRLEHLPYKFLNNNGDNRA